MPLWERPSLTLGVMMIYTNIEKDEATAFADMWSVNKQNQQIWYINDEIDFRATLQQDCFDYFGGDDAISQDEIKEIRLMIDERLNRVYQIV